MFYSRLSRSTRHLPLKVWHRLVERARRRRSPRNKENIKSLKSSVWSTLHSTVHTYRMSVSYSKLLSKLVRFCWNMIATLKNIIFALCYIVSAISSFSRNCSSVLDPHKSKIKFLMNSFWNYNPWRTTTCHLCQGQNVSLGTANYLWPKGGRGAEDFDCVIIKFTWSL